MCLSKAYVEKNGNRELLLEEIASVKIDGNELLFKTLFGEQKIMKASIKQIDFVKSTIFLGAQEDG